MRPSSLSSDTVRDLWLTHSASWGGVRGRGATRYVLSVSFPEHPPRDKPGLHPEGWGACESRSEPEREDRCKRRESPTFVFDPQNTPDGLRITWVL